MIVEMKNEADSRVTTIKDVDEKARNSFTKDYEIDKEGATVQKKFNY